MLSVVLMTGCLAIAPQEAKGRGGTKPEAAPPAATVADRVTLRDGRSILGLIESENAGPKVGFDMLVRRAWAEAHVPDLAEKWVRNADSRRKPIVAERWKRLAAWREERTRSVGGEDATTAWIGRELKRLEDPEGREPLLAVRIAREGCRAAEKNSDASRRLLAFAWLGNAKDPEDRTPAEVQDAVEARGFFVEVDGKATDFPSLDGIAPLVAETEAKWVARRAATEMSVDAGRRFIRYSGILLPDPSDGRAADGRAADAKLDLSTALAQVGKLLDPAAADVDPLAPALAKIADEGGVGAVVTSLEMAPDLSRVAVELTLWTRGPRGWAPFGSRGVTLRPEDVDARATVGLGQDPQVQSAFDIAESLGLGAVTAEMKERSLKMGAATSQALGQARSKFLPELNGLAFPVLEPPGSPDGPAREADAPPAPEPKQPEKP